MTDKRYSFNWERGHPNFWDNHCDVADCYLTCEDVYGLLNELYEEKESWKRIACSNSNFVSILFHELDMAQEQGYEVSDPFKELMEEKS